MSVPTGNMAPLAIPIGNGVGAPSSLDGHSPVFVDAVHGLLGLGDPSGSFNSVGGGGSLLMASGIGKRSQSMRGGPKKSALTSSVSSSSAGENDTDTSDDEDDDIKMDIL